MTLRDFSPEAVADLKEIWEYIARDNPEAADSLEEDILRACRRLVRNPYLGHTRSDLAHKTIRFWLVRGNYLIIYRVADEMLDVLRILHAARNVGPEL